MIGVESGLTLYAKTHADAQAVQDALLRAFNKWSLKYPEAVPKNAVIEVNVSGTQKNDDPSVIVKSAKIRFFEGDKNMPPQENRTYKDRFPRLESRYIYWHLDITHQSFNQRRYFNMQVIYYRPDGSIFGQSSRQSYIEPGWTSSWHNYGLGWEQSGQWPTGSYRVDVFVEQQKVTSGSFLVE